LASYLRPVWAGTQPLTAVTRERGAGQSELIAEGYEQSVTLSAEVKGKLAEAARDALQARLTTAQAEVGSLNEHKQGKKRYHEVVSVEQAAQAILKRHRVDGLLKVTITEQVEERWVRAYGNRPAGVRVERVLSVRGGGCPCCGRSHRLVGLAGVCHQSSPRGAAA
jgi:hypothetical protein